MSDELDLREILTFPPGEEVAFRRADYPWLAAVHVHLKGGGAGPDGEDGYVLLELYGRKDERVDHER